MSVRRLKFTYTSNSLLFPIMRNGESHEKLRVSLRTFPVNFYGNFHRSLLQKISVLLHAFCISTKQLKHVYYDKQISLLKCQILLNEFSLDSPILSVKQQLTQLITEEKKILPNYGISFVKLKYAKYWKVTKKNT